MYGFPMQLQLKNGTYIVLRPYILQDAKRIPKALNSIHVANPLGLQYALTKDKEEEWITNTATEENEIDWAIAICKSKKDTIGKYIGGTSIFNIKSGAISGISISKKYHGMGIGCLAQHARMHYVANQSEIITIRSDVLSSNKPSLTILDKVGYAKVTEDKGEFKIGYSYPQYTILRWISPNEAVWNMFWGDDKPTVNYIIARKKAIKALRWADKNINYL